MATQRFDRAQLFATTSFQAPLQRPAVTPTFSRTPLSDLIGDSSAPAPSAEVTVNLHLLRKAVGWGLGIEGFAALSLYGIWRLFHFWLS